MGIILLDMAMSLDGFAADEHGGSLYPVAQLQETGTLEELIEATGAVVMGRRAYEMANGDFTGYEYQVPIFVLTHQVPEVAAKGENGRLSFTFVTGGVEIAIEQARAVAGDKGITVIGGPRTFQQCIRARLVDQIQIRLMPILLGTGLRLFEESGIEQFQLERTQTVNLPTRTDIRFRILKHNSDSVLDEA